MCARTAASASPPASPISVFVLTATQVFVDRIDQIKIMGKVSFDFVIYKKKKKDSTAAFL